MNKFFTLIFVALLCLCAAEAREPFKKLKDGRSPLLGERSAAVDGYVVVLYGGSSAADLDDVIRVCNCENNEGFRRFEFALVGFSVNAIGAEELNEVRRHAQVEYIEHEQEVTLSATQSPPGSWGLDRIDQTDRPLSNSYSYNNNGEGVNIYIVDSGIRYSHIDFGGRAKFAVDYVGGDGQDCIGHGTHVASSAGGAIHGVAKSATLWSVRVFACELTAPGSRILAGMDWIIRNRRRGSPTIINLSLGANGVAFNDAVQAASNNNILSVIAAGNSNADACTTTPASAPSGITVAASDINDVRYTQSNFGGCVDIYAPGVAVPGASFQSDNGELVYTGTSMAAPHVAGAAALLWAVYPFWGYDQVANTLISQAARDKIQANPAGTPNLLLNIQYIPDVIYSPLVFDVNFYRAFYADLAPLDPTAASNHWRDNGIAEGRAGVAYFWINEYRSLYGDLAAAGLSNLGLVYHFMAYGYPEGREGRLLLSPLVFNVNYYLDRNTDVANALGYTRRSAVTHWVDHGVWEGRQASANFNVGQYKALNGDIAPFPNDRATYHYVEYGYNEGRRATF